MFHNIASFPSITHIVPETQILRIALYSSAYSLYALQCPTVCTLYSALQFVRFTVPYSLGLLQFIAIYTLPLYILLQAVLFMCDKSMLYYQAEGSRNSGYQNS